MEEKIEALRTDLAKIGEYEIEDLISREKWGEITLEGARHDLKRIFTVTSYLQVLPLEFLTDTVIQQTHTAATQIIKLFEQIDAFSIGAGNPTQICDGHVQNVKVRADAMYNAAAQWIPFLAYQKGDIDKNINQLTDSVSQAQGLISSAKTDIETKKGEIDGIITQAREASAAAGAAVFTKDFADEAKRLSDSGATWLKVTGGLAVLAAGVAVGSVFIPTEGLAAGQLSALIVTKFAIIGLLITSTLWCGRIYKALMHQSTVNRHRSLSIQTLQAFSSAASDSQAKDAVLLEATRAVFGNTASGYVDSKTNNQDATVKVFGVAKSVLPKSDG